MLFQIDVSAHQALLNQMAHNGNLKIFMYMYAITKVQCINKLKMKSTAGTAQYRLEFTWNLLSHWRASYFYSQYQFKVKYQYFSWEDLARDH